MQPSSAVRTPSNLSWAPWVFVLAFLIIIGVNTILIVLSIRTFSGLETEQAYEQGIKYNGTLDAAAANERLGWQATVSFVATDANRRRIEIRLTDHAASPLTDLVVSAILVRPTNAGLDQRLSLASDGQGIYTAEFTPTALGNWDLRILARGSAGQWQSSERIFLR